MLLKPSLAALLSLAVSGLGAPGAHAQPMPGGPEPYSPWDGARALAAPSPEPEQIPSPLERDREWTRRSVELVPELGVSLPRCRSQTRARSAPCASLGLGRFFAFDALYRPGPYFAFGGGLIVSEFGQGKGPRSRAVELGALARVYLLESGRVEPYFELWLGGGTQRTLPSAGPELERDGTSAGARIGGGIDFYLGEHARLGPSLGAAQFFAARRQAQLAGAYFASARLAFALGSRL